MTTSRKYSNQGIAFLKKTRTSFVAKFSRNGAYGPFGDDAKRDIYSVTLTRGNLSYSFEFGQSLAESGPGGKKPNAYAVLACLTKVHPGSFGDFCADFAYDTDSLRAFEIYKKVVEEFSQLERLFSNKELLLLSEVA